MFRLTHILNLFFAIGCAVVLYTLVQVKSQIAVEERQISALEQDLQGEFARRDALQAEWARLQQRNNLLALGRARFGDGISELAEEAHVTDLPEHPHLNGEGGSNLALGMFMRAVENLTDQSPPAPSQETPSSFISRAISDDLNGI